MKPRWLSGVARHGLICFAVVPFILFACLDCARAQSAAPAHPLDPLTAGEIGIVHDTLVNSGRFSPNTNFVWIELAEPAKALVNAFKPGDDFPRRAKLAAVDFGKMKTFEVVVDIKKARIESIKDLHGLQPGITDADVAIATAVVNADPRIKRALIDHGLKIPGNVSDAVHLLYYSIGHDESLNADRHRLLRVLFASDQKAVNWGSPVLGGVMAVIDLYTRRTIKLYDFPAAPPKAVPHDVFDPHIVGPLGGAAAAAAPNRDDAIKIGDHVIRWRNWRFRYGFNLREGLVLYEIAFNDSGKWRPIVYRASVSEVMTAYAYPDPLWSWMEIFDEGGGGLGLSSLAVKPGREVPGSAHTLGVVLPEPAAPAFSRRLDNRIYAYERDGGNLLYYWQDGRTVQMRSNELVVGFLATLGNYDYSFNWIFREDGSFSFEVKLAGEVLTKFVRAANCQTCVAIVSDPGQKSRTVESHGDDRYGTLVYPGVIAVDHQHWFNVRLDFDIDGVGNAVMENDTRKIDRRHDRAGAGGQPLFVQAHTVLSRAREAKRDANDEVSRTWTIYNPNALNRAGRPAGYTVVPGEDTSTQFPPSRERGTAAFTFHHFWVTPYRESELYAAGAYPDQAKRDYRDTLYRYADNASIFNKDIVVWYSLGETHAPRVEDFPIMSEAAMSVSFVPDGFFSRNAALGPAPEK